MDTLLLSFGVPAWSLSPLPLWVIPESLRCASLSLSFSLSRLFPFNSSSLALWSADRRWAGEGEEEREERAGEGWAEEAAEEEAEVGRWCRRWRWLHLGGLLCRTPDWEDDDVDDVDDWEGAGVVIIIGSSVLSGLLRSCTLY